MSFPTHEHKLVKSLEDIEQIKDDYSRAEFVGFDTETDGLEWYAGCTPVGLGIGFYLDNKIIKTYYIPTAYLGEGNIPEAYSSLRSMLTGEDGRKIPKVGANIKFDYHMMLRKGVALDPLDDVQVVARILRTEYRSVALDSLMEDEFNATHVGWDELVKWCRKHGLKVNKSYVAPAAYASVDPEVLGSYCGEDVYWTILLWLKYSYELNKEPKLKRLYEHIERPLLHTVIRMEEAGVRIDKQYLEERRIELTESVGKYETQVYEAAGKVFNINSGKQLAEIFAAKGIEPEMRDRKKTVEGEEVRTKTASYDRMCLEKYAGQHDFVDKLLRYKECGKFLETYVEGILRKAGKGTQIHTSLHQESARTGRFGCSDPNLMNLPREDVSEFRQLNSIRKAFVPADNFSVLLTIDYSQIEYRLMAHFSKDPVLVEMFNTEQDFHSLVAASLFNVSVDKITKEQRSIAKTFNFAQLYGSGLDNLALKTKIAKEKCEQIVDTYYQKFRNVRPFKKSVEQYCMAHGFIENPFGRRRTLPKEFFYRGVNTLIQGTAADILKIAALRVDKFLLGKRSKLMFPVHDEFVINWNMLDGNIVPQIIKLMTTFEKEGKPMFRIPIEVEPSWCPDNWGTKKEFTGYEILEAELYPLSNFENFRYKLVNSEVGTKWLAYLESLDLSQFHRAKVGACLGDIVLCIENKSCKKAFFDAIKNNLTGGNLWVEDDDFRSMPDLPWEVAYTPG